MNFTTEHLNSRRLNSGTLGNRELFVSGMRELSSQIPAKAGTTKHALAGFRSGVMGGLPKRAEARTTYFQIPAKAGTTKHALAGFRSGVMGGFQNGLLRSREANPELRTQKSRRNVEGVRERTMNAEISNRSFFYSW
ncbi:MAG: hypothetical protein K9N47_02715 [Prosthecobacter sp.]|uniref:hypothetical protein n=1 Tax=Prosthecobacter sp. TaxID=1965333 RepID=UPI0025E2B652|nr:hypothetical protein [Prosthecobacter sp.]MCF7785002.1 hypothetical protein [Prosthecobacter sp.]